MNYRTGLMFQHRSFAQHDTPDPYFHPLSSDEENGKRYTGMMEHVPVVAGQLFICWNGLY